MPEPALQQLRGLVRELQYEPNIGADRLRSLMTDVTILIVADQRVRRDVIDGSRTLQMIVRAGEGPGEIAVEDASTQGIFVSHCPEKYAEAVAELALGLIVALDRDIVSHALALREGRWDRSRVHEARGLAGRALGILGFDVSAQRLARLATDLGMQVYAWCPGFAPPADRATEIELCNFPHEVAQHCDVICVCQVPQNESLPVVDKPFLEAMVNGSILVHVGHPHAVDEAELAIAVQQRGIRVALDSHPTAPNMDRAKFRNALLDLPGAIGTPDIARTTGQARDSVAAEVVAIVRAFLVGGELHNCLNLLERSPATWQLVLRVRDQVGVMASILDAIRADGINAEEITSRVFIGAKAAWCSISLDERPSREAMESIRRLPDIMHLELRAMV